MYRRHLEKPGTRETLPRTKMKSRHGLFSHSALFPRSSFCLTRRVKSTALININFIRSKTKLIC